MTDLRPVERLLLSKMKNGPVSIHTFNIAQSHLRELIRQGLCAKQKTERGKMLVGLTAAGAKAMGLIGRTEKREISIPMPCND